MNYQSLLIRVNELASQAKTMHDIDVSTYTTEVYHKFLQKLYNAGFMPFVDVYDNLTDKQRGYIPYGAVAFTTRDDKIYATYVSLHMNTVTDVPDKVYVIEYEIYTHGERSRVLMHTSVEPTLLQKTATRLINSKTMRHIDFSANTSDAKFASYTRPCSVAFINADGNVIEKSFMDCELLHPSIKINKPIGE